MALIFILFFYVLNHSQVSQPEKKATTPRLLIGLKKVISALYHPSLPPYIHVYSTLLR